MRFKTPAIAAGALIAGIVLAPIAASASNGHAWLLGRSNYETATTTVTNSAGTPLSLKAKAGYAPLRVNSAKTVTNLSADRLDGLSSGSFLRSTAAAGFARTTGKTGIIIAPALDTMAKCPAHTIAVSGGGFAMGVSDYIWYSGPGVDANFNPVANTWKAVADGSTISWVSCYSPTGAAIPGTANFGAWFRSQGAGAAADSTTSMSSLSAGEKVVAQHLLKVAGR